MNKHYYVSSSDNAGSFNFDVLHNALSSLLGGTMTMHLDPNSEPMAPQGWEEEMLADMEKIRVQTKNRGDMHYIVRDRALMCEKYVKRWLVEF